MKARLGIAPIAWSNDDLPELGAKTLPTGEIPQNVDAFDYIVGKVAAVNADETTPDYPEGIYVIKDRVIQVIDGNVRNIPLNELK